MSKHRSRSSSRRVGGGPAQEVDEGVIAVVKNDNTTTSKTSATITPPLLLGHVGGRFMSEVENIFGAMNDYIFQHVDANQTDKGRLDAGYVSRILEEEEEEKAGGGVRAGRATASRSAISTTHTHTTTTTEGRSELEYGTSGSEYHLSSTNDEYDDYSEYDDYGNGYEYDYGYDKEQGEKEKMRQKLKRWAIMKEQQTNEERREDPPPSMMMMDDDAPPAPAPAAAPTSIIIGKSRRGGWKNYYSGGRIPTTTPPPPTTPRYTTTSIASSASPSPSAVLEEMRREAKQQHQQQQQQQQQQQRKRKENRKLVAEDGKGGIVNNHDDDPADADFHDDNTKYRSFLHRKFNNKKSASEKKKKNNNNNHNNNNQRTRSQSRDRAVVEEPLNNEIPTARQKPKTTTQSTTPVQRGRSRGRGKLDHSPAPDKAHLARSKQQQKQQQEEERGKSLDRKNHRSKSRGRSQSRNRSRSKSREPVKKRSTSKSRGDEPGARRRGTKSKSQEPNTRTRSNSKSREPKKKEPRKRSKSRTQADERDLDNIQEAVKDLVIKEARTERSMPLSTIFVKNKGQSSSNKKAHQQHQIVDPSRELDMELKHLLRRSPSPSPNRRSKSPGARNNIQQHRSTSKPTERESSNRKTAAAVKAIDMSASPSRRRQPKSPSAQTTNNNNNNNSDNNNSDNHNNAQENIDEVLSRSPSVFARFRSKSRSSIPQNRKPDIDELEDGEEAEEEVRRETVPSKSKEGNALVHPQSSRKSSATEKAPTRSTKPSAEPEKVANKMAQKRKESLNFPQHQADPSQGPDMGHNDRLRRSRFSEQGKNATAGGDIPARAPRSKPKSEENITAAAAGNKDASTARNQTSNGVSVKVFHRQKKGIFSMFHTSTHKYDVPKPQEEDNMPMPSKVTSKEATTIQDEALRKRRMSLGELAKIVPAVPSNTLLTSEEKAELEEILARQTISFLAAKSAARRQKNSPTTKQGKNETRTSRSVVDNKDFSIVEENTIVERRSRGKQLDADDADHDHDIDDDDDDNDDGTKTKTVTSPSSFLPRWFQRSAFTPAPPFTENLSFTKNGSTAILQHQVVLSKDEEEEEEEGQEIVVTPLVDLSVLSFPVSDYVPEQYHRPPSRKESWVVALEAAETGDDEHGGGGGGDRYISNASNKQNK